MPSQDRDNKAMLRRRLRAARDALTPTQQKQHARQATQHLIQLRRWRNARRVACYFSCGSELATDALIAQALRRRKRVFLPRISRQHTGIMHFIRWQSPAVLRANKFGINEPVRGTRSRFNQLDLILVPLVGATADGDRLGMGMGFYDRWLSRRRGNGLRRPLLVGFCHALQQVDALPTDPWDVTLDVLATERGVIHCHRQARASV